MRIAQIAPLFEAVPPKTYGGTERVVSWLSEALIELGHEVTLFASSDSHTSGRLMPSGTKSLRLGKRESEHLAHHYLMLEKAAGMSGEFDIYHGHLDYLSFPILRARGLASVHTLHGRLDLPLLEELFTEYSDIPLISIADHQRKPQPHANWKSTIYHGLPRDLYDFKEKPEGDYLLFLGRICPDKGVDKAIEIAHRQGMRLKIAAKIDPVDEEFYKSVVAPLIAQHDVEFIGEANDEEKNLLLGNATALLFPIDWEEPFGLVMIEAMACGTPIVAFNRGSVPELIVSGKNGFICSDVEGACEALSRIDTIDRSACRSHFENHFTSTHMAENYVRVYEEILKARTEHKIVYFPNSVKERPTTPRTDRALAPLVVK